MAAPDLTTYSALRDGRFVKKSDGSGPYSWNGISMALSSGSAPIVNFRLLSSLATTNSLLVKAGAATLTQIFGRNNAATALFLKLYNKATAPVVGTDPVTFTFYLPASSSFAFSVPDGYNFTLGIGIGITGAVLDADSTAVAAGDVQALNLVYY